MVNLTVVDFGLYGMNVLISLAGKLLFVLGNLSSVRHIADGFALTKNRSDVRSYPIIATVFAAVLKQFVTRFRLF